MKQRNTWVLLLILAAVVTVLVLLVNPPELTESEEAAEPGLFADLDLDRIFKVVVNTTRGTSTLRREGENWVVEEFDDFPADLPALEEAVTTLRDLELGDVVSGNKEKQGTFQVDQTGIEVLLYGANEDQVLAHFFLGKPGHDYRSIYFRQADSEQVHLVDQQLRGRFDRGARTWRNRRPFNFALEEVSGMRLAAGESGEPLTLKLDDQGNWIVVGEEEIPADKSKVELIARSFAQLAADDFPEEPEDGDLASYGLDTPLYTYSADLLDGSTLTLLVGSVEHDENRYYAKRDDSPIIYILGKFRIRNLSKTVDEIRLEPTADPPAGEK